MNNGYQDHVTGAKYIRNVYFYSIVGDEDRGYAFCLFFGDIRIGNIVQVDTLDELITRLDMTCDIIWNEYNEIISPETWLQEHKEHCNVCTDYGLCGIAYSMYHKKVSERKTT